MIKCPGCGADNLIGAIFCRSCGDKLDIDELRPDEIAEAVAKQQGSKLGATIRNLVGLVVFLVLGAVILLILLPPSRGNVANLDANALEVAKGRYNALVGGRRGTYTFSHAEVNALARDLFGLTDEARTAAAAAGQSGGALQPDQVWIEFPGGDQVRIVLKSKLMGTLPMFSSMTGTVSAGSGGLKIEGQSYAFGRLPMPIAPLQAQVTGRIMALVDSAPDLQKKVAPGIRSVKLAGDKAVIER